MNNELNRRMSHNLTTVEPTLTQDLGSAGMKLGGGLIAYSVLAGMLPLIGVWAFVPVLAMVLIVSGFYARFIL